MFTRFIKRKPRVVLLAVAIIGCGASISYFSWVAHTAGTAEARTYPNVQMSMMGDNAAAAINLVDRGIYSRATTSPYVLDARRPPGYPLFLAFFYALTHSFYPAIFAQVLLAFASAALLYAMARRFTSDGWALGIATLYLLLPDTLLASSLLLEESVFTALFLVALWLLFFSSWRNRYWRFAFAGLILAIATYVRPASLYLLYVFVPAYLLLYIGWNRVRREHIIASIILIVTFSLTLVPWYIRNERTFGTADFVSLGSYQIFEEYAGRIYQAATGTDETTARFALEDRAGIPHGPTPFDIKYDAGMKRVSTQVFLAHPVRLALLEAASLVPFFLSPGSHDYWRAINDLLPNFAPQDELGFVNALNNHPWQELGTVVKNHGWFLLENFFWLAITLLVLLGLWWSKDRRLAWMFFAIVMYFALVTGPIAHARYRIPVEPLLLIGALSTAVYWLERKKNIVTTLAVST